MAAEPIAVQPDLEAWVWAQLHAVITSGLSTWEYTTTHDYPPWQVRHFLQVDCRATSKKAARDRAERARQLMLGLAELDWDDGVVTLVDTTEGPFWLPDEDGCPRYTARYEVRCHPRALVPAAPD